MKKSLIALAALATVATAAQAQSSVTVYGIVDLGVTTATNVNGVRTTGVSNGGLSTSRLGFRGTEDLGAGLKANFNLESELLSDTGDQTAPQSSNGAARTTATQLFSRASWVGLSKDGTGAVRLGRVNRIDYDMAATYDAFGGNNIGGWVALKDANGNSANEVALKIGERISNAVDFKSASIAGFTLTYQHGYGEVAGNQTASKTDAYGIQYKLGNFDAAYTFAKAYASDSVSTKQDSLYASYNFGVATVTGGTVKYKVSSASTVEPNGYFVGTRIPVAGTKFTVLAQYAHLSTDAATPVKHNVYSLGTTYGLSNRTTLYVIGARSDGKGQNVVSETKYATFANPADGKNAAVYSVGIRHSF